ncbi:PREDICTED: probable ATP-dependent RNA helicase DDX43 [Polistes dominula]|uniref:Probable ATP-dependent RNA helicase DDX43 n=1 Tax=Polistes dominula TaxID=743375 RepID=A0ABM1IQQ6_POLDO|nr:PREDICTED: probable ATP-dependent RNA helicase DDX43 [Polistes dominula]
MSNKLRSVMKYYNDERNNENNLQEDDTKVLTITIYIIEINDFNIDEINIRNIEKASNTEIFVDELTLTPNVLINVTGTLTAIIDAKIMIYNQLKRQASILNETINNYMPNGDTRLRLNKSFITMPIDANIVSRFIGKERENINKLEDESNTIIRIKMPNKSNPYPTIVIIGFPISLRRARILIKKFLKKLSSNEENSYQSLTMDECNDVSLPLKNSHIIKNLYREDLAIVNMPEKTVKRIRTDNNIEVKYINEFHNDFPIPKPILTFKQAFNNHPTMLKKIKEQGLKKPNPFECQALPILLSGKDMLGISPSSLDKTLAFLLPALIHISKQTSFHNGNGPNVLILVANKIQAQKIQQEVQRFSYFGIKAANLSTSVRDFAKSYMTNPIELYVRPVCHEVQFVIREVNKFR